MKTASDDVEKASSNHQQLNTHVSPILMDLALVQERVQGVMREYDFIVVAERLDESLVVLQLLLGLKPNDLLYLSSKVSGSYHVISHIKKKCTRLSKPSVSPVVHDYLSSEEWYTNNYGDYLLYKAVNASLDATIERLGQKRFVAALETYQKMLHRAQKECGDTVIFPCSQNGTLQSELSQANCYDRDMGCGYPCLDNLT